MDSLGIVSPTRSNGSWKRASSNVESSNNVIAALQDYRRGPADFADCLLARANLTSGCSHTVTFDRKAAKLPGFELLK